MNSHKQRFLKLWQQSPNCHWCHRPTILPEESPSPHYPLMATLDHLNSKLKGRSQRHDGIPQTVLSCYECNQRRAKEEQASLPIDELHKRSQQHEDVKKINLYNCQKLKMLGYDVVRENELWHIVKIGQEGVFIISRKGKMDAVNTFLAKMK